MRTVRQSLPLFALLLVAMACQNLAGGGSDKKRDGSADAKGEDGLVWSSRAYPTGDRQTSALLVERGMPAEVQSGQRYEYEIRLTNLTDMVLVNVVLSDTAPAGMETPEGSPAAQSTGALAVWRIDALEANASQTIRASGIAGGAGSFRHIAQVTYDAPLAGTTMIVQPRLELERTVPELVIQIDGVMVTYVVKNSGTGTARDVVIEETLPDGYSLADGANVVRLEVGALGAGESKTMARKIIAANPGSFEGSAKVTGFGGLTAATETQTVKITMPTLRAKAEAPARAAIGQIYSVTLTLGNDGDGPAHRAKARLKLPEGATYIDSDDATNVVVNESGTLTWSAGSVEPGKERKLVVRVRADTAAQSSFAGRAEAHGAEEIALAAEVEQYGIATVGIDVRDEVDPLQAGTDAVYLVSVRNQGTAAATNLRLVCRLEEGMSFVEASGSSEGKAVDATIVFEPVAELAAKATLSWRIVVKGETAGDRRFHVEIRADQLERPDEASESTRFFE